MAVAVIVVNRGGKKFLEECLESVLAEEGEYQVVVVDDGSKDGSVKWLEEYKKDKERLKTVYLPENRGAAEARNIGVANSQGEHVLFLDVDTKIKPGWFKEVDDFFVNHKKTGAGQVKLWRKGTERFDSAGELWGPLGFLKERAREAEDRGQFDEEEMIFSGKSAGMVVRRKVFEQVGGMDSDYEIFWEDTDLCWRIWLAGWKVRFCPGVVVEHAYGTEEKSKEDYVRNKVYQRGCRNMLSSVVKNIGWKRGWWVLADGMVWLLLAVGMGLRGEGRKGKVILKGWIESWWWLGRNLRKRGKIQKQRKISDSELWERVGKKEPLGYYLGKAEAYIGGGPF